MRRPASAYRPLASRCARAGPGRRGARARTHLFATRRAGAPELVAALICAAGLGLVEVLTFKLFAGTFGAGGFAPPPGLSFSAGAGTRAFLVSLELLVIAQAAMRLSEAVFQSRFQIKASFSHLQRQMASPTAPRFEEAREELRTSALVASDSARASMSIVRAIVVLVIWVCALVASDPVPSLTALACAVAAATWSCVCAADRVGGDALEAATDRALAMLERQEPVRAGLQAMGASAAAERLIARKFMREFMLARRERRRVDAFQAWVASLGLLAAVAAVLLARAPAAVSILAVLYAFVGGRLGVLAARVSLGWGRSPGAAAPPLEPKTTSSGPRAVILQESTGAPAHVVLSEVDYCDPQTRERLEGWSLELQPGSITAVISATASGSAALGRLVTGEVLAQSGQVVIDGVPLELGGQNAWRELCGHVPASTLITNGTLEANLRLSAPNASESALWGALAAVGLSSWSREHGLWLKLGASGEHLTSGMARRLSLARALLRSPRLLLIEPPLQPVAMEDEQAIKRCLLAMRNLCTILVQVTTTSAVEIADQVILLGQGRILESGPVDVLLKDPKSQLAGLWAKA